MERKRISAELVLEEILDESHKFIYGVRIGIGDVSVGDSFNYLYKIKHYEVGGKESDNLREEIYQFREVSLEVKSIKFRGKSVNKVYQGHTAHIELVGNGIDKIELPNDLLGKIEIVKYGEIKT